MVVMCMEIDLGGMRVVNCETGPAYHPAPCSSIGVHQRKPPLFDVLKIRIIRINEWLKYVAPHFLSEAGLLRSRSS